MFQPEVQFAIKVTVVFAVTSAYVLTFAWGYEGRQQARQWREIACTYRLGQIERATPGLAEGRGACAALERAGLGPLAGLR